MKLLIASDIHGSASCNDLLMAEIKKEGPDKIILLGDILYHGPRNELPEGYEPKSVLKELNECKDKIICVKGNCDGEVDQMVLDFPIMAPYAYLYVDGLDIWLTHGHIYNQHEPLPACSGILLCGHTHIPAIEEYEHFTYLNPGSIALPKNDTRHSFMLYENRTFQWKDLLSGEIYQEYVL